MKTMRGIFRGGVIVLAMSLSAISSTASASVSGSHDYHKVQAFLAQLAQTYPQTTKLIEIGQSDEGESIVGVQIGNGPVHNMIVATHHGNEYGSTEVAVGAAADFAKNPIAGQTIYVIPVLNISGFDANRREESLNGDLLDANRNYPGPCGTEGPFTLKSTKALADFVAANDIVASATLHTYGPLVLYPWGISTQQTATAYNSQFISLAQVAANGTENTVGNSTDALYPADGTYEDYAFWKHGIWSLLFELGNTHSPSEAELTRLVNENVPGLRAMFAAAPKVRAVDHDFKGKCDVRMFLLDRHDE